MFNLIRKEEGQDLAEYALLLSLIALVVILAIPPVATAISNAFTTIANHL